MFFQVSVLRVKPHPRPGSARDQLGSRGKPLLVSGFLGVEGRVSDPGGTLRCSPPQQLPFLSPHLHVPCCRVPGTCHNGVPGRCSFQLGGQAVCTDVKIAHLRLASQVDDFVLGDETFSEAGCFPSSLFLPSPQPPPARFANSPSDRVLHTLSAHVQPVLWHQTPPMEGLRAVPSQPHL